MAVGQPSSWPRPSPRSTLPAMANGRVNSRVAVPGSAARRASRMRLELTGSPSRLTGATVSASMPCALPSARSTFALPARPRPKVKSSPVTTAAAPICWPSTSPTKSSAVVAASLAPNSNTSMASAPAAANRAWRWLRLVSRKGGTSGLKCLTGCGSKVATMTGRHSCAPRCTARPTTAWWPRWKPSKLPSATTAPRRGSGTGRSRVRRCMVRALGDGPAACNCAVRPPS